MFKRLLRPLFNKCASLLGIPEIQRDLTETHSQVFKYSNLLGATSPTEDVITSYLERRLSDQTKVSLLDIQEELNKVSLVRISTLQGHLEALVQEQNTALQSHLEAHVEAFVLERDNAIQESLIAHLGIMIDEAIAGVQRSIDISRVMASQPERDVQTRGNSLSPVIDDGLYMLLEDFFRGSTALIKERQKQYLPYVAEIVTTSFPLLDLGCGRGEWLELLRDKSICASGIDSNLVSVNDCQQRGLDVVQGDLVEALRNIPPQSLGAVTMFQVMEHLPFAVLVEVLRLVLRALKPGGVLIGEVPNSETLSVGATTFWIDPTHEKPLFPELLKFLAQQVGYTNTDGLYSTPLRDIPSLGDIDDSTRLVIMDLFNKVYGPGDFALIATA